MCKVLIVSSDGTSIGLQHCRRRYAQTHIHLCYLFSKTASFQNLRNMPILAHIQWLLGEQWLKGARFLLFPVIEQALDYNTAVVGMLKPMCLLCRLFKITASFQNLRNTPIITHIKWLLGKQWLKGARFLLFPVIELALDYSTAVVGMLKPMCLLCFLFSKTASFQNLRNMPILAHIKRLLGKQ